MDKSDLFILIEKRAKELSEIYSRLDDLKKKEKCVQEGLREVKRLIRLNSLTYSRKPSRFLRTSSSKLAKKRNRLNRSLTAIRQIKIRNQRKVNQVIKARNFLREKFLA